MMIEMAPPNTETPVLTVSELNSAVKRMLNTSFQHIWIEGEISNLVKAASGHWYFSLKDKNSQIRCAMFKGNNRQVPFEVNTGDKVIANVDVTLYEPRGDYQVIVKSLQAFGIGALHKAFLALKQKLEKEGLFSSQRKQPIPPFPQKIGLITSPKGAAIQDMITTAKRRFPGISLVIYPCLVQGIDAGASIIKALSQAVSRNEVDILILGRGGGSLEDLWPFNEECVARAVANCPLPIVSAVGHETDFSISDFVADLRAPTPTAAAELVTPDSTSLLKTNQTYLVRLSYLIQQQLNLKKGNVVWLRKSLLSPKDYLNRVAQTLDELKFRLGQVEESTRFKRQIRLDFFQQKLSQTHPGKIIQKHRQVLCYQSQKLFHHFSTCLKEHWFHLECLSQKLAAISPLATLSRGYAIAKSEKSGHIIRSTTQVNVGEAVWVNLYDGSLHCIVKEISHDCPITPANLSSSLPPTVKSSED